MNDYLISILLGIVEGLTEFLPVSSTAHIRLCQDLLDLPLDDAYWKMYAIVIQLGAILAVVVYFRKRLMEFVRTFPKGKNGDLTVLTHPITLILGAFVVTAGPAYLLDKTIGKNLESLKIIGFALIVGGVVMWLVDRIFNKPTIHQIEEISWPQAIWIGMAQIVAAAFPGTSRSMATIAAGQTARLSRTAALEFSFFLSIPVMFAATGFKLLQALRGKGFGESDPLVIDGHRWGVLAVGFVVSFFVAWAVIAWFMAWVRKRGFTPFAIYRILVGCIVLWVAYRGGRA